MEKHGYKLVWSDEFDGESLDHDTWGYEIGYIRNNELQYYNDEATNVRLENGCLILEAREDGKGGMKYTSGSINTGGKKGFKYGYFEIKAILPKGQGMWPAFWMLGCKGRWPADGEIDILELVGGGAGRDDTIYANLHWGPNVRLRKNYDSDDHYYTLPEGVFNDEFHTFGLEWTPERCIWYCDDKPYFTREITAEDMKAFHEDFYILLNLAVGGAWPGSPDETTVFPNKYVIDYVRVYQ